MWRLSQNSSDDSSVPAIVEGKTLSQAPVALSRIVVRERLLGSELRMDTRADLCSTSFCFLISALTLFVVAR
jgi:hypothetical protein